MSENSKVTVAKHRSPPYPAFSLRTAVDKANLFYATQRRNAVHADVAIETFGYSPSSSNGKRTVAALIAFGFLAEDGAGPDRRLRVTELGRRIAMLEHNDPEFLGALREAAKTPKIFREMLEAWPDGLPSDAQVTKFLTYVKNFNPDAVAGLIKNFKDTCDYAGLAEGDSVSDGEADIEADDPPAGARRKTEPELPGRHAGDANRGGSTRGREPSANESDNSQFIQLPLPRMRMIVMEVPADLTATDLEFVARYLEIMRDTLLTPNLLRSSTLVENDSAAEEE